MAMPIKSHGKKTADYLASDKPTILFGLLVISNGTDAVTVDLWDSDDASATGDTCVGSAGIGATPASGDLGRLLWFGPNGVHCSKGLWADLTGTGTFIVYTE